MRSHEIGISKVLKRCHERPRVGAAVVQRTFHLLNAPLCLRCHQSFLSDRQQRKGEVDLNMSTEQTAGVWCVNRDGGGEERGDRWKEGERCFWEE